MGINLLIENYLPATSIHCIEKKPLEVHIALQVTNIHPSMSSQQKNLDLGWKLMMFSELFIFTLSCKSPW
jgi:hypothetical protein